MNIDPDKIYHLDALRRVQRLLHDEEYWLRDLEKDVTDGFASFTKELEKRREVVASLQRMYNGAAEQRMLATTRWVYNSKFPNSPSLLQPEQAVAVQAAIDAGKVVRSVRQPMKDQSVLDVWLIEFTDPAAQDNRWAVRVEWPDKNGANVTVSDHPTRFDADTRFRTLLTIAESLE